MAMMRRKGQAEIMDGLILMLISAVCATALLKISSDYGILPVKIYEETYSQKLAQNTLLSLYHITDTSDPGSPYYRKSIMVAVSQELSDSSGPPNLKATSDVAGSLVRDVLTDYADAMDRQFMFAITDGVNILDETVVSTDDRVTDSASFAENAGSHSCASAALTYPVSSSGNCPTGGQAGNMCYAIFEVCVWLG